MPPLWLCDWTDCRKPAVQRDGDCVLCDRHLCRAHLQDQWHTCPKLTNWEEYSARYVAAESRRMEELCRRIDGEKLCVRASRVRQDANVPCTVDLSPKSLSGMMGGQNCHAEIVFADGVVWLARFRLRSPIAPPTDVRDYVLRSEVATLEYLRHHIKVPAPRVFDWACETDPANMVGVAYILMEKMDGKPLDWQGATAVQKKKIVLQLADIMLELEKHPFDKLGSLVTATSLGGELAPAGPHFQVQGLAEHSTFRAGKRDHPLGPFNSSREAMRAIVNAHLQMIAGGEIGTTDNAVNLYLAHRFRLDVLDSVWGERQDDKFFLKHPDDKGDHILINTDFDIVGIIDWEWCSTVSKEEAFSSPCMMWPVAAFYDGSNELTEEEQLLARVFRDKGREDLAGYVLEGRRVQRLMFALGAGASQEDEKTFACLFMGLKRAFHGHGHVVGEEDEIFGREEEEWKAWKAEALVRWESDALLQVILKEIQSLHS